MASGREFSILIIDDGEPIRRLLDMYLSEVYVCATASSADEAAALYQNYRATLRALAGELEARDVETAGHSDRVVAYSLRLGREIGLSRKEFALEQGALLHDIERSVCATRYF
jgi:HD-GYP domain-containing protein (c-di-GMP phosphodiesterase class II)